MPEMSAPREAGDAVIRVVDIDDKSLSEVGQWPWPRTIVAQFIDKLREAGSAVIAFDIDFAEPDRTSPKLLLPLLAKNGVGTREAEKLLATAPDLDQRLAEAMGTTPVVTGFIVTDRGQIRPPLPKAGFAFAGDEPLGHVDSFPAAISNLPGLEAAAAGNGFLNQIVDWDHVVSPGSADFAARRKAVSVARRRDAPGRPRRVQLCRPCGWCKRREEVWRKDRTDGNPHRTADDTDRCCRPRLAPLRGTASRPVRFCRRRPCWEIRSRPFH